MNDEKKIQREKIGRYVFAVLLLFGCFLLMYRWDSTSAFGSNTKVKTPKKLKATPMLMVTCPSDTNLRDLTILLRKKVLDAPGLKIHAVYPANEADRAAKAEKWRRRYHEKLVVTTVVPCDVEPSEIFGKNACTPYFESLMENARALIFPGGPDIPPNLYGADTQLLTDAKGIYRHTFEISFLHHLFKGDPTPLVEQKGKDFPVLAVCLGMQSMNIALGGKLTQDIPSELYGAKTAQDVLGLPSDQQHRNYKTQIFPGQARFHWHAHHLTVDPSWKITETTGAKVLSAHHQAVAPLGEGLTPLAWSADKKVVEAVALKGYPNVLGVQFHPEYYVLYEQGAPSQIDESMQKFHHEFWNWFGRAIAGSRPKSLKGKPL